MKKRAFTFLFLFVLAGVTWLGVSTSRAGYETAEYKTVEKDGSFQIRQYPQLTTVATATQGSGSDSGFMRLFKYITGENESETKIAMTTPVFMPSNSAGSPNSMHFVLPKEVSDKGAPDPSRKGVKLSKFAGGKYAVIRFNGKMNTTSRKEALQKLKAELAARNLSASGGPIYAGYDSPWTPGPLRRNEVLLKLRN